MRDRIRQLEQVGRGAFAEVFRAVLIGERGTERTVAIKRPRPDLPADSEMVERFVREAQVAVGLSHPNVVHAIELGRDDQGYFLVCEWLEGDSLANWVQQLGEPSSAGVVHLGRVVCQALTYLHSRKNQEGHPAPIFHLDICPGNILITSDGIIKLADFGLACVASSGAAIASVRGGTPGFAAPEQLIGIPDHRADLYGLAATLKSVRRNESDRLNPVLKQAIEKDPEDRFSSAELFARALLEANRLAAGPDPEAEFLRWLKTPAKETAKQSRPNLDSALLSVLGNPAQTITPVLPHPKFVTKKVRWPFLASGILALGLALFAAAWSLFFTEKKELARARSVSTPEKTQTPIPNGVKAKGRETQLAPLAYRLPPEKFGKLNINAIPWAVVRIDQLEVCTSPCRDIQLRAGKHKIVLDCPPAKLHHESVIHVAPEQTQTLLVNLKTGQIESRVESTDR